MPDETSAVTALRDAGWAVAPGALYRIAAPPALRITVSSLDTADLAPLAAALAHAEQPTPPPRASPPDPDPAPRPRASRRPGRLVGRKCTIRGDSGRTGTGMRAPEVGDMASGGARKGIWIAVAVAIIIIVIVLIAIASGGDGGGNGY